MRGMLLVVAAALLFGGCHRERAQARAETPDAAVEVIALPGLDALPVSSAGREAVAVVARARAFGGSAIGAGGTPSEPVAALRKLWGEAHSSEAFVYVMRHGTTAGKLFALSGLWVSDHVTFERELGPMRTVTGSVPVLENGCTGMETPTSVSELIEKSGAVRLEGPNDDLYAWSLRNPGKPIEVDIVGGGYPSTFRPHPAPASDAGAR